MIGSAAPDVTKPAVESPWFAGALPQCGNLIVQAFLQRADMAPVQQAMVDLDRQMYHQPSVFREIFAPRQPRHGVVPVEAVLVGERGKIKPRQAGK